MLTKKEIQGIYVIWLFVLIMVTFSNQAISQQLSDQLMSWTAQAKASIPQIAWQKIPTNVRPLIDAPKEYLEMSSRIIEITRIETDEPEIGLLVKSEGNAQELESIGARIGSQIEDIFTVHIPINRLGDLATLENVVSIQPSMRLYPSLDASILENGANLVHQGNYSTTPPIYSGYTGNDILVTTIDSGIDWEHDDFINDSDGTSRILYIWDQTLSPQANESHPPGFFYGVEYTQMDINEEIDGSPVGYVRTEDTDAHGTHVTGIIAGNGSSTGGGIPAYTYVGMAPQANILVVKTGFYMSQVIDGIHYAMQRADEIGKPLVINLSLGTQYGAHDGTSLLDQSINNAVNAGNITIVVSAGNEGTDTAHGEYIHAEGTIATGSTDTTTFSIPSYSPNSGGGNDLLLINSWYQGGDYVNVKIITPNGYTWSANTGSNNGNTAISTADGAIYIDNAVSGTDPNNGDHECYIQIWDYYSSQTPETGEWKIVVTGNTVTESGHYDSWIYISQVGDKRVYYTSTSGSNKEVIGSPGTAEEAITVAAHSTKTSWTDYWDNVQTVPGAVLNDLAYFSSAGPTRDDPGYITGRQKPDICASGFGVISGRSTDAIWSSSSTYRNKDGVHLMTWGTSMSAPHITGAVALMLQKDPTLKGYQVKTILTSSANSDSYTGSVPNYLWGYGKLNIYNAMEQIQEPQQAVSLFPSIQVQEEVANEIVSYILNVKNLGSQSDSYDLTISGNSWPTSVWDVSGSSQINNTGTIAANSQIEIIIKVQIPTGTTPNSRDNAIIRATSASNGNVYDQASLITCTLAELPWMDSFTSVTLDTLKWVLNDGPAEVNSIGSSEPSLPYSLNLNGDEKGGDMVQSQSINLSGKENVMLSYYYERTGGGNSPEIGEDLWVDYYNSSGSWVNLRHYLGSGSDMSTYMLEQVLLPADAFHKRFKIRFRNVGTAGPNDDWFIDNILLEEYFYPDISIVPDSFEVTLSVRDSTTRVLTIENVGEGYLDFVISTQFTSSNSTSSSQKSVDNIYKDHKIVTLSEKASASPILNKNDNQNSVLSNAQIEIQRIIEENERNKKDYYLLKANTKLTKIESGNTIYVDVNNTSGIEDGSKERPYRYIQTGVANASEGDIIIVKQGVYYEKNIDLSKSLTLRGNGAIIDGSPSTGSDIGFEIHGGASNVAITNFIIINCYWPIFVYSTSGGGTKIINNTLVNNDGSGIPVFNDCTIMNNIIAFNGGFGISYHSGNLSNDYNDVYGNTLDNWSDCSPGTGSISADPLFIAQVNNDFHLQAGSPCLDAGNPDPVYNDSDGSRNDIGAFGGPYVSTITTMEWLSISPISGTVVPQGSQDITIQFNAKDLTQDSTYHANLIINSNDPDEPTIRFPVHLTVGPPVSITGTVDSAGVALEGAVVQAWDNYPNGTIVVSDTSDANGNFSLYVWKEGIYDIRAFASGFFPIITENFQAPASGINLTIEVLPSVTATNEWVNFYSSNTTFRYAPIQIGDVVFAKDPDSVICGVFEIDSAGNYGLMPVYRDDATTTDVDEGANPGDTISFEINKYKAWSLGPDNPIWTTNGDILEVDLTDNSAPIVAHSMEDITMNEDDPERIIADLDTIFIDPDNDSLIFSSQSSVLSVKDSIDNDHHAIICLAPDWYGEAELIFTAYDGFHTVSDKVQLIVYSINDPPNTFNLLSPANGSVIDTLNPTLIWQQSFDPDKGDTIKYSLIYGRDSSFVEFDTTISILDTIYIITEGLVPSNTYFWTVAAVDMSSAATASLDTFKFVTYDTVTFVDDRFLTDLPKYFSLSQNYPNPFNPSTTIKFDLPKTAQVTLKIFNILGEDVATLVSDQLSAGSYSYEWDASNLASGVYLYRFEAGDFVETKKMMLMK